MPPPLLLGPTGLPTLEEGVRADWSPMDYRVPLGIQGVQGLQAHCSFLAA
jgi:hypothetical protein